MNEELTNDEVEIDLVDLGYVLLDKWRYLLISLIAGAVLLGAYSFFFIAPTYESTAKLYVVSASDDSVVNLSDLNLGTSLTADYEQLMLSYPVLNKSYLGVTENVFARNLLLWSEMDNGIDPESSQGNNNMAGAFERFSLPGTSSYGFGITVKF